MDIISVFFFFFFFKQKTAYEIEWLLEFRRVLFRSWVTVALSGEGGDELFAGYRHYRLYRQLTELEARLGGVPSLAAFLSRLEPLAGGIGSRRMWKGLWIAQLPAAER